MEGPVATLASQGILGSLCALLITALAFLWRAYHKSQESRIAEQKEHALDQRELVTALVESTKAVDEMMSYLNSRRR